MSSRPWIAAALIVAGLAWPAPTTADRAGAEGAAKRGWTALKARRWPEAEAAFREAAIEDATYLPARGGLGEAMLGAGATGPGLEHLRAFVDDVDRGERDLARLWSKEVERAQGLLRQRDAEGIRLGQLVDEYVRSLLRLAEKAEADDVELARLAVRQVQVLRPRQPDLGGLEWRLGLLPRGEALFDGTNASSWKWFDPPGWSVIEGQIVGRAHDVYAVTRSVTPLSGDYDVRAEVRVLGGGKSAVFLLQAAWTDMQQNLTIGMVGDDVILLDGRGLPRNANPPRAPARKTRGRIDSREWNLFELRFQGDTVTARVRGEEIGTLTRAPVHASGYVALQVLLGEVAFRRVEVARR